MATWQEFCDSVTKLTNKAIVKTGELADSASLHLKLAQKEAALAELYEQFGKLTYKQIKQGDSTEEKATELIEKLDALYAEISAIKAEIQAKKESKKSENDEQSEDNN